MTCPAWLDVGELSTMREVSEAKLRELALPFPRLWRSWADGGFPRQGLSRLDRARKSMSYRRSHLLCPQMALLERLRAILPGVDGGPPRRTRLQRRG